MADQPDVRGREGAGQTLSHSEVAGSPPRPLSEVQEDLRNRLASDSVLKEREHYLSQLRKTAQVDEKL